MRDDAVDDVRRRQADASIVDKDWIDRVRKTWLTRVSEEILRGRQRGGAGINQRRGQTDASYKAWQQEIELRELSASFDGEPVGRLSSRKTRELPYGFANRSQSCQGSARRQSRSMIVDFVCYAQHFKATSASSFVSTSRSWRKHSQHHSHHREAR